MDGFTIKRWSLGAKILIGILVVLVLLALAFGSLVAWYWWQIKHGNSAAPQTAYGGFSSAGGGQASLQIVDRAKLETSSSPSLGRPGAPVTIVEFVDFKCPNCKAEAPIVNQVLAKYGTNIRFISRNFPIESLHPGATELALVATCAGRQNVFWKAHDAFFSALGDTLSVPLSQDDVAALSAQLGLSATSLTSCMNDPRTMESIRRDYVDGLSFGVRGTPTFFVNGNRVEGTVPLAAWDKILSALIQQ